MNVVSAAAGTPLTLQCNIRALGRHDVEELTWGSKSADFRLTKSKETHNFTVTQHVLIPKFVFFKSQNDTRVFWSAVFMIKDNLM